jgi:hypothetical protein
MNRLSLKLNQTAETQRRRGMKDSEKPKRSRCFFDHFLSLRLRVSAAKLYLAT